MAGYCSFPLKLLNGLIQLYETPATVLLSDWASNFLYCKKNHPTQNPNQPTNQNTNQTKKPINPPIPDKISGHISCSKVQQLINKRCWIFTTLAFFCLYTVVKAANGKPCVTCYIPLGLNSLFWARFHLDFWFVRHIENLLLALLKVYLEVFLRACLSFYFVHAYYDIAFSSSCDRYSLLILLSSLSIFSSFFLDFLFSTEILPSNLSKAVLHVLG